MDVLSAAGIPLSEALVNSLVGFGIVFLTLLFLSGVISLFRFVGKCGQKTNETAAEKTVKAAPTEKENKPTADPDESVIAVIMAAAAEKCGADAHVVSITKSEN